MENIYTENYIEGFIMQKLPEAARKRNGLCIWWDDASHQFVTNEAHNRRISCSEMIRTIVLEQLKKEGVKVEQPQAV